MFCVLESSVVKHHTDNALKFRGIHLEILLAGARATFMNANAHRTRGSYLHHFTSDFRKFPNFPIVEHSNFIGLTCNRKILRQCGSLDAKNLIPTGNVCSGVCCFYPSSKYKLITSEFRQGRKLEQQQQYKNRRYKKKRINYSYFQLLLPT